MIKATFTKCGIEQFVDLSKDFAQKLGLDAENYVCIAFKQDSLMGSVAIFLDEYTITAEIKFPEIPTERLNDIKAYCELYNTNSPFGFLALDPSGDTIDLRSAVYYKNSEVTQVTINNVIQPLLIKSAELKGLLVKLLNKETTVEQTIKDTNFSLL